MSYKTFNANCIIRLTDNQSFPSKDGNADYEEFKRWVALGNTPEPADIPPVEPITKVTMRQARLALFGAGLLTTVNDAVANMTGPAGDAARIEWEYSQEVQRNRGLVAALGTQMGMSAEHLDALFTTAAAIP